MKNRGFTLIELIAVIAVIALLGVIITVNFGGSIKETNQKQCDEFVREIEDAACVYAGLSNKQVVCNRTDCAPIKLSFLINEGLIKSETDTCTGNDIDINQTVSVTWDATGEKHCEYNGVKTYER